MYEWWQKKENQIADLENEETHVTYLYGRKAGNEWEYAITRWQHRQPYLIILFKAGKITSEIEE